MKDAAVCAPTIRVLLNEDVKPDAELVVRELKHAGLQLATRVVDSETCFVEALRQFAPDVILSDFTMPGFDGMQALRLAREICPDTPFIFVSGTLGEEYAIRALKSGATDYVLKTNLVRLPATVERALAEAEERRRRHKVEVELELTRERLGSVLASLPDVVWSVDARNGRMLFASAAVRQISGYAQEAFLDNPRLWLEVVHRDDRPRVERFLDSLKSGGIMDLEYRIVHADGTVRWVQNRGRVIRGTDGAAERVDGLVRDVTEQVEHRRRIERLSRIRDLLGAVNSAIVRVRERQPLFEEFTRIAVTRGGFVLARIVEVDRDGKARLSATTEADPSLLRSLLEEYNRGEQAGLLFASVLRSGETVVSNDVASDERSSKRALLTREGNFSLALLPMNVAGRIAGFLGLRAREPGFFDQEELHLLSEMVSNISFALELMEKQERISYLALYDALTGLPNRTLFHERLTQSIETARHANTGLALVLMDLERFKAINDTLGSQAGDRVLQVVAQRLQKTAGDVNRLARLGSDVYAVMFPSISGAEEVARDIEQAAKSFGAPLDVGGQEIRLAAKAGIAVYPDDAGDADTLFRNAEASLKRAKQTGDRYLFYAPHINARVSEQVELEHRLRRAVERGELFLHYQPKVDLVTRRVAGLEALMRWKAPDGTLVSPAKFIPILEQTGLIFEAGQHVFATASAMHRQWRARGLNAPRIAVNVSALQLRRRSFVDDVRAALGAAAADGGGLDLEITESLLMAEVEESIRKLRELRELGLRIALDDFGTGYSSLAYLAKLPLDALKIDRGFVRGMTEHADHTSIISTTISLAQSLRLKVVAEGVETEQQAQLLRLLRCDEGQGYLFSPPVPGEKIEPLLVW